MKGYLSFKIFREISISWSVTPLNAETTAVCRGTSSKRIEKRAVRFEPDEGSGEIEGAAVGAGPGEGETETEGTVALGDTETDGMADAVETGSDELTEDELDEETLESEALDTGSEKGTTVAPSEGETVAFSDGTTEGTSVGVAETLAESVGLAVRLGFSVGADRAKDQESDNVTLAKVSLGGIADSASE